MIIIIHTLCLVSIVVEIVFYSYFQLDNSENICSSVATYFRVRP